MIVTSDTREMELSEGLNSVGFKIDGNNAKAFDLLSSALYKDKPLAVIRELSCNAYDAHIAAGKKDVPIWVHLPTPLEPFLSVRDEGVGLSHDDVMNLYSTYFASTKSSSNDFVGAFGLGSKSPFSYVDSFTVTSIYNGEKRIYTAFKNDKGVPSITCMHIETTNAVNGVEINVPVKNEDVNLFVRTAAKFYATFTPFPTVTGNSSSHYAKPLTLIDTVDNVAVYAFNSDIGEVSIRQGNVVYPLNLGMINTPLRSKYGHYTEWSTIIDVPIGSIEVTAGREEISYSKPVIAFLNNLYQTTKEKFKLSATNEINSYTNLYDALTSFKSYKISGNFLFGTNKIDITYKCMPLEWPTIKIDSCPELDAIHLMQKSTGRYYGGVRSASRWVKDDYYANNGYLHNLARGSNPSSSSKYDTIVFDSSILVGRKAKDGYDYSSQTILLVMDKTFTCDFTSLVNENALELGPIRRIVVLSGTDVAKKLNDALEKELGKPNLLKCVLSSSLKEPVVVPAAKAQKSKGTLKGFKVDEVEAYVASGNSVNSISRDNSLYRPIELAKGGYYMSDVSAYSRHGYLSFPNNVVGDSGINKTLKTLKIVDDNNSIFIFPKSYYKTLDKYSSIWKDLNTEVKPFLDTYVADKDLLDYAKKTRKSKYCANKDLMNTLVSITAAGKLKSKFVNAILKKYEKFIEIDPADELKEAKIKCLEYFNYLPAGMQMQSDTFDEDNKIIIKFPFVKDYINNHYYTHAFKELDEAVKYINAMSYIEENNIQL